MHAYVYVNAEKNVWKNTYQTVNCDCLLKEDWDEEGGKAKENLTPSASFEILQ